MLTYMQSFARSLHHNPTIASMHVKDGAQRQLSNLSTASSRILKSGSLPGVSTSTRNWEALPLGWSHWNPVSLFASTVAGIKGSRNGSSRPSQTFLRSSNTVRVCFISRSLWKQFLITYRSETHQYPNGSLSQRRHASMIIRLSKSQDPRSVGLLFALLSRFSIMFPQWIPDKNCGLSLTVFERCLRTYTVTGGLAVPRASTKVFVVFARARAPMLIARTNKPVAMLVRAIWAETVARAAHRTKTGLSRTEEKKQGVVA